MKKNPLNKKDKFSNMDSKELTKIIKMLTIELDGNRGLPVPRYHAWSEKTMRQFIRWCYRNLKEEYIAKVEVADSFDQDKNNIR